MVDFLKLVMIYHEQHVGNSCENSVDESSSMKEVENCGPGERENDGHENGGFDPSSESGEMSYISDDFWHTLEISDESSLDGEVGKRLNQMVPIPVSEYLVIYLLLFLKLSYSIFYSFPLYWLPFDI